MDSNLITFKHGCFAGDLIYALAGIKALCGETHKAVIYQWLDQKAKLYEGAVHPYGGSMMTREAFDKLKPLIEAQPYIEKFEVWEGQPVNVDLDKLRQVKSHMPYGNITRWLAMVFVEMTPRDWEPWMECHYRVSFPDIRNKIVINRTSRYRGQWIDYFHMKKYNGQMLFVGMKEEYEEFKHDWGLDIEYFETKDIYSIASLLSSCKLFIGNQSMCFAIAEAMKVPRILEVCDFAPNVQPNGPGGYYFRAPEPFAYLVDKLMDNRK